MLPCFYNDKHENMIVIKVLTKSQYDDYVTHASSFIKTWLHASNFKPEPLQFTLLPSEDGRLMEVLVIVHQDTFIWSLGALSLQLPMGDYYLEGISQEQYASYAIGFGLGAYQFQRYKTAKRSPSRLWLPDELSAHVQNIVQAVTLVRDCINTPAEDMGPSEFAKMLEQQVQDLGVVLHEIVGDALLENNFPCIHMVGRASDDAPRLIDFHWGDKNHPKVTLVGKGVCFDSGGLDIKPASGMLLMKKDMGGAAHVLALAKLIMQSKMQVHLRVLIPLAENVISQNAYRPGDVVKSRKGLTVEVGNTDAEGRLLLADALTEGASEKPELLIDFATLTGAARVALGPELPAMFSSDDDVAKDLLESAKSVEDPLWRMPLFAAYRDDINSAIADLTNNSSDGLGGAINAALFLQAFVPDAVKWVHFDLMAWNTKAKAGRPVGGEAMGLRAVFHFLQKRYG